jgi:hypothetical protein
MITITTTTAIPPLATINTIGISPPSVGVVVVVVVVVVVGVGVGVDEIGSTNSSSTTMLSNLKPFKLWAIKHTSE